MSEHSPTPWKLDEVRTSCGRAFRIGTGEMLSAGKGCCIIYDDHPGNPHNERSANADFIVKAVNSHDALIQALEEITEHYCALVNSGDAGFWDPEKEDPVKHARAALSQAKSEEEA